MKKRETLIIFVDDTSIPVSVCVSRDNTLDSDVLPSGSDDEVTDETLYAAAQDQTALDNLSTDFTIVVDTDNTTVDDVADSDNETPSTSSTSKNNGKKKKKKGKLREYRWRNMLKKGCNMVANTEFLDFIQNEATYTELPIQYFKMLKK